MDAATNTPLLPVLPGYEHLELIGKGGFSRVYRADQAKLKRKVAVKVLNFNLSEEADRVNFARETELMGRVSTHPNIVTVHDTAFTAEGQPCIVMELYPGGSLADLINQSGRLETGEVLEVGVAIASALQASHQSGVLHCDLKPQNILISEFGQPALGDFGISTFAEEHTRTGKDAGAGFTLPYAAPEVVEGESPTIASDVYSLAATLYTALCGRRPFAYRTAEGAKPTAAEHARRILLEPVRSLVDEGVPTELDALIRGAMSKEPAERPASAAVFANACHQIGQALGFSTSAPRIADQGALRRLEADAPEVPAARGAQPAAPAAPASQPASTAAPERVEPAIPTPSVAEVPDEISADVSVDATRVRAQFEPGGDISTPRRRIAATIGLVALIAVAGLLFAVTRSGEGDQVTEQAATPTTVRGPATDPILAPTRPRDVELERVGSHDLVVRWMVPEVEIEAGDVTYEVRRQDDGASGVWTTETTEATITGVADDEGVCITVLAVRGNRTSSPTDPTCSTPMTVDIALDSTDCASPCSVVAAIDGSSSTAAPALDVLTRSLQSVLGEGFDVGAVSSSGNGSYTARITVADDTPAGDYLVVARAGDGSTQTTLLRVT